MCAELEKINFDKNFNFFTVGKNHIVIEKTEENVFMKCVKLCFHHLNKETPNFV